MIKCKNKNLFIRQNKEGGVYQDCLHIVGGGLEDLEDNETLEDILSHRAEEKIKEELAQRIAEPIKVKKVKQEKMIYAGKYEVASNFLGSTKQYVIDLLRDKKCSELMLIN